MAKETQDSKLHRIEYGNKYIEFFLTFAKKAGLSVSVHPDQTVTVRAPFGKSIDEIKARVKRRAAWIVKQQDYFERFQPLPLERKYVSGETYLYLGRQYRLKVVTGNPESAKLEGRFLWVHTSDKNDRSTVRKLVQSWYRDHAIVLLSRRLDILMEIASKARIPSPQVEFRRMSKRWGSCAKSGNITLNTELVKAPIHCIDYVIAHELCHLRYKNHSPSFWRLLSRLLPDWGKRKLRLEEILI